MNQQVREILDRKKAVAYVGRRWWNAERAALQARQEGRQPFLAPAPKADDPGERVPEELAEIAHEAQQLKTRGLAGQDLQILRERWAQVNNAWKAGNISLAECHLTELRALLEDARVRRPLIRVPF